MWHRRNGIMKLAQLRNNEMAAKNGGVESLAARCDAESGVLKAKENEAK